MGVVVAASRVMVIRKRLSGATAYCAFGAGLDGRYILGQSGGAGPGFAPPLAGARKGSCRLGRFRQAGLAGARSEQSFRDLGASGVVLIGRKRDGGKDSNDRYNDHQFDQRKSVVR